jgi:hypothetical protein
MFRLIEVRPYRDGHGHRFVFCTETPVFLRRGRGLPRVSVPKGGQVEVSLVHLPLILGGREIAVIYGGEFITFRRGPTLTAEEVLREVSVKQRG